MSFFTGRGVRPSYQFGGAAGRPVRDPHGDLDRDVMNAMSTMSTRNAVGDGLSVASRRLAGASRG
jgi:hypothetical protein